MGEKQAAPQPGDRHGADTAAPSPSPAPSLPEEPAQLHSIFDRRQKVVIVFLVATAATCEYK